MTHEKLAVRGKLEPPFIIVRNFFVDIPQFCIGREIRSGLGRKITKSTLVGGILFSCTSLLERFLLVSLNMNAVRDHYVSTTLLAVAVFLFTLKCSGKKRVLMTIGRKFSTWLYILHQIFIICIRVVIHKVEFMAFID